MSQEELLEDRWSLVVQGGLEVLEIVGGEDHSMLLMNGDELELREMLVEEEVRILSAPGDGPKDMRSRFGEVVGSHFSHNLRTCKD